MARHLNRSHPSGAKTTVDLRGPYGAFRDNRPLRSTLVALLIVGAMLSLFAIILSLGIDAASASLNNDKLGKILHMLAWAEHLTHLLIIVLFCFWINRACKNGWLLDAPKMKTTPARAVGNLFTPLLCLWKPLSTLGEIRNASYGRQNVFSTLLPTWWVLLLATCIITISISLLHRDGNSAETLLIAQKLTTVSAPLTVITDYLAIILILGITHAQNKRLSLWRA
ncbi:MAG: DUF4328 domain-containing protein [Verrucomicrobiae bacterium]|nr:DUF4328 domain-containing protein [Verrucomicrobiae bacterium]NNJ43538.1 DUF4328 domain-containing protein [Akkermansiaceae bacterium]